MTFPGSNGAVYLSELGARFLEHGLDTLLPRERLNLLLTAVDPTVPADELSSILMIKYKNLHAALNAPIEDLRQLPGISDRIVLALKLIREASSLYTAAEAELAHTPNELRTKIKRHWVGAFWGAQTEALEIACLDSRGQLLPGGLHRIADGTIDRTIVYPREVMEIALRTRAASIMIAHNHTNEDPEPSEQDKLLTRMLVLAGETLGIKVLDHLVFARNQVFSFAEEGLI